jgi:protein-L-isoaspartate O-methyltransferase
VEALSLFESLYGEIDGKAISHAARQKSGDPDLSLTYGEIVPSSFRALIDEAKPQPGEVFYDLGSGTGKPVILASLLYPFSRLVGIERVGALATAARRVLKELKARADPPVPKIRFITGDILKQDFSDAGVVYSHATAFTYELMDQVEERLHTLPRGARVALVGKTLASKAFAFKKGQVCEMNWGPSLASLYVRT